jgi:hypothetical protein
LLRKHPYVKPHGKEESVAEEIRADKKTKYFASGY